MRARTLRSHSMFIAAAAAAATAALAAAPAASADSIAYTKDGSVWLSTPDGSRQFQVTDGGAYTEVSQSDDGHLVALHGDTIAYLDRQGNVLADIKTPVSTSTDANQQFYGPFDPVISPDGKKVAYTYYFKYITEDPYCNRTTNCYVKQLYQGTAYTYPDRLTAWDEPGMRRQSGWIHPDWIGNDLTMLSDPSIAPNHDVVTSSPTLDKDAGFKRWFSHPSAEAWRDADMTNDQTKLAGVTGRADDKITFAYVRGLPVSEAEPNYPTQCAYEIKDPAGGKFSNVSWSPSGTHLAYSDGGGISTVAIPTFGSTYGDCGKPTENVKLVIPGGASPFWGPADVPAPRPAKPAPAPTPAPTPGPKPVPGPGKDVPKGTGLVLGGEQGGSGGQAEGQGPSVSEQAATLKLGKVLAKGLTVGVAVDGPGTVTVSVTSGGKTVATGKAKAKAAGTISVKATFTKAARKRLARSKQAKFTVLSTFASKAGGPKVKQRATLTIKK